MPRTPKPASIDGILVVDKPRGKTSHDVVETVRRLVGFRQIGHLGTLDPLATGVLVLALGRATRLARFYGGTPKALHVLGAVSDSRRTRTTPTATRYQRTRRRRSMPLRFKRSPTDSSGKFSRCHLRFQRRKFTGVPAHELARKHKPVKLEPVEVEVFEFKLTGVEGSCARFAVECGSGTYIRSLAHDLGKLQGTGAHLAEIVRTAVGEFTLDHAVTLAELAEDAKAGKLDARVIRLENMLPELPRATVLPIVEKRVRHGAKFNLPLAQIQPGHVIAAQGAPAKLDSGEWKPSRLRVFNQQGHLIAIAEPVVPRTYQPVVVLEATP